MLVYLVRHGKATDDPAPLPRFPKPTGYPSDFDRPLTPRGEAQVRYLADKIRTPPSGERRIRTVLSSKYPRALQSAEILSQALGAELALVPNLEVDHPVEEALSLIDEHRASRALMLVGHNPQLGELIGVLCSGLDSHDLILKTGELVILEVRASALVGSARILSRLRLGDDASGDAALIALDPARA